MARHPLWLMFALLGLAACGGGSSAVAPDRVITTPAFTTPALVAGQNSIRLDRSVAGDSAVLADFDNPAVADPTGYRKLITLSEAAYASKVNIEVIAAVSGPDGSVTNRLLRLTTRQGELIPTTSTAKDPDGVYWFKGESFAWASVDGGPPISGYHATGLETLKIDFKQGLASIDLRTENSLTSGVEVTLVANDLPFNVTSGAFGGDITLQVRFRDDPTVAVANGSLRGNIGGEEKFVEDIHQMVAGGLYTATGTADGKSIRVDGAFVGAHEKALPSAGP